MFDFGKGTGDNHCHQITERLSKKYISEQCVKNHAALTRSWWETSLRLCYLLNSASQFTRKVIEDTLGGDWVTQDFLLCKGTGRVSVIVCQKQGLSLCPITGDLHLWPALLSLSQSPWYPFCNLLGKCPFALVCSFPLHPACLEFQLLQVRGPDSKHSFPCGCDHHGWGERSASELGHQFQP